MYGVSKINIEPSLMMISVQDVEFKGNSLARYLQIFADTGVVVDMISQSAPHGTNIDFSFTASASDLTLVMKAILYRRWSMSMFPCLFLLPEFRTRLRRQRLQEASSTQVKEAV